MTVIIFLIVLAVLILIHEFGHFITAKKIGARVDEFGLGFPPRAWGKKVGETIYSLNWIPFGGFVKIFGETPDEESISGPDSKRSFYNKPKWAQAIVLAGGVVFNFLFAWILISICFFFSTDVSRSDFSEQYQRYLSNEKVYVINVPISTPAYEAGLRMNDVLKGVMVQEGTKPEISQSTTNISSSDEIISAITNSSGKQIAITYERKGEIHTTVVTPKKGLITDNPDKWAVGIAMADASTMSLPIHLSIYEGGKYTLVLIKETAVGLYNFFGRAFIGKADFSMVSGPVGIAGMVGDAARTGLLSLFMFTAIISINLGVINLAPFPALDGGRLLFVLIESIIRRKIPVKVANALNGVGFIILLALMVFVTYKDLIKIF